MSVYCLTTSTRFYHVVENPPIPASGGRVLCGRRLERYGILVPMSMAEAMMASDCMCRRCKVAYEQRREAVRA